MSFVDAFNKQMLNLLTDLSKIYPDNLHLKSVKNSLFLLIKTSPRKPITTYYTEVYVYKDKIDNEDEDFFLNFNLKGTILEEFDYIKEIWKEATIENKNILWKYFKVFNKLAEKKFQ